MAGGGPCKWCGTRYKQPSRHEPYCDENPANAAEAEEEDED